MKYIITIVICFLFIPMIIRPQDESRKIYDDTEVAIIRITMDAAAFDWMINNPHSDSLHLCSLHFKNSVIDTVIQNVGIRIRGNTSRDSKKKSFKLDFNDFESGREFYDLDEMNLNGEHNDPSIIRSKICWDFFNDIGMKASRAAHAAVHINGEYFGLYISVEQIDDEFLKKNFTDDSGNLWKCLYPADLLFINTNPDSYKMMSGNRRVYDLVTNKELDDYTKLSELIYTINETPQNEFPGKFEDIISLTEVIKYFAVNAITASWDDYWFLRNNYYLYYEPAADKFHWIPYDYDNTFGVDFGFKPDWATVDPYNIGTIQGGSPIRPLVTRLFSVNDYRNLYTHFIQFYSQNVFRLNLLEPKIDELKSKIISFALSDNYRTLDWGFTNDDFNNSYSAGNYSFENGAIKIQRGLKNFIDTKNVYLQSKLNFKTGGPLVYSVEKSPALPEADEPIEITASVFSPAGLAQVVLEFHPGNLTVIEEYQMIYSPVENTKKVEEFDRWICTIPALGQGGFGRYQIKAVDLNGNETRFPRSGPVEIKTPGAFSGNLIINEFLASNAATNSDLNGDFDDWIEIYNPSEENILLDGLYLTDNPSIPAKWKFPNLNTHLPPQGYLIVWCDEDEGQSGLHTNFKLDAQGEFIGLVGADGVTFVDSLSFGEQATDISYGRYPDGGTDWIAMPPTPGLSNLLTSVDNDADPPVKFNLSVYPNPFNLSTNIRYSIPGPAFIKIAIYDILGNEIFIKDEGYKQTGSYNLSWNALDKSGTALPTGVYICKIDAGHFSKSVKIMILK